MALPSLDVIIVNWNAGAWLAKCVAALAAARPTACRIERVVVVDNASTDGSCDALASGSLVVDAGLPLTVIRNPVNCGFAIACNQGAVDSHADFLLFLNPDTLATTAALDGVIHLLETHASSSVQIAGVRVEAADGPQTLWLGAFPTARTFIWQALGLRGRWTRDVDLPAAAISAAPATAAPVPQGVPDSTPGRHAIEVSTVGGAFLVIRRNIFQALEGFDEQFFMYYDEVDLCVRARLRGVRAMVAWDVHVYHHDSVCSDRVPAMRLFYLLRSRLRYARAHFSLFETMTIAVLMCTYEPVMRLARAAARRGPERFGEVVEAYARFAASLVGRSPDEARARARMQEFLHHVR